MNYISKISEFKKNISGYWGERTFSQLEYAVKLSVVNNGRFDSLIESAVDLLEKGINSTGVVSNELAKMVENKISDLSPYAKKYTLLNVAHAHIDMNWMWDYSETVAITLGTFRTMLDLMEEYPDFTFSQSQASVYRIVEKHDPDMLEEIKVKVKEGRWEVTASTWVEADKNMPNGESHARHILYTKRYLTDLLELPPDTLLLDFEPDTFGHNRNVPEILAKGGIKYYYLCRGYEDHHIFRWKAPSGNSVLVYREPLWYNMDIFPDVALHVPEFCEKNGMNCVMKVYGVGDHGGGPTRKDLERLIDMNTWPVFPNMRFSTYREYFNEIDDIKDSLPVVEGEMNFVFTGCYTTQSRIKTANRIGEAKLDEAETISSLSGIFSNGNYPKNHYEKSWRKVLFNQFHDILPGSGTVDTREFTMGEFQKVMAYANTGISNAMKNITSKIDTASFKLPTENTSMSRSEGGGVGFEIARFNIPHPERGTGLNRIVAIFNPTQFPRSEAAEIVIWDWEGEKKRLSVNDCNGKSVQHQILEFNDVDYWTHSYIRLLIKAEVPAYGYAAYVVSESEIDNFDVAWPDWPRLETPDEFILENELIRAEFNSITLELMSLIDKSNGVELITRDRSAGFRYIEEDAEKGMTAWVVGRHMAIIPMTENIRIVDSNLERADIKQWISYEQEFKSSKFKVTISLDKDSEIINYDVECDWQERPVVKKSVPQLNYQLPLSMDCNCFTYDIPFGTIDRKELPHDVPANSWMTAVPVKGDRSVMLMSKTKYGFRGNDSTMAMTLIRSSYDPDPYPENGIHKFSFAVAPVVTTNKKNLIETAYKYNHPVIFTSVKRQKGEFALTNSFIKIDSENAVVSAIKIAEDLGTGLIIRLYETNGMEAEVAIAFDKAPVKAYFVDLHEQPIPGDIEVNSKAVKFNIGAYSIESVLVEF